MKKKVEESHIITSSLSKREEERTEAEIRKKQSLINQIADLTKQFLKKCNSSIMLNEKCFPFVLFLLDI